MPSWKKVIVSGSDATLNSLNVINGVTGSLFGTASYAVQALSASYAPIVATFPYTGSALITGSLGITGSLSVNGFSNFTGTISSSIQPANNLSASLMVIGGTTIQSGSTSLNSSAVVINPMMSASANSQALVGLDIAPTFNNGGFTGVTNTAIRLSNTGNNIVNSLGDFYFQRSGSSGLQILSTNTNLRSTTVSGFVNFGITTTEAGRFASTGNFLLGTTVDDTVNRLQVLGSARITDGLTVTGSLNITGSSNLTGSFEISNGTDSVKISRGSGAAGRLIISRPGSTGTQAISIGGSNSELSIGTGDAKQITANGDALEIKNSVSDGSIVIAQTGGSTGTIVLRGTSNINGLTFFTSTKNLALQNGGTFTDAGYRLDVSGSARITDGLTVTGSLIAPSITGSLFGTASYATQVLSSSFATTASFISGQYFNTFSQSAAAATWSFAHNLSNKNPVITVWNDADEVIIPEKIVGTNTNLATIFFPFSVSGYASATVGSIIPNASGSIGSTVITGSLRGQVSALSIASTTASLDLATNNFFTLTLANGANTHISASNIQPGQIVNIRVTQGSAGTGTLSFNSTIKQSSGSLYTGSMVANSVDMVSLISFDQTNAYISYINNFV